MIDFRYVQDSQENLDHKLDSAYNNYVNRLSRGKINPQTDEHNHQPHNQNIDSNHSRTDAEVRLDTAETIDLAEQAWERHQKAKKRTPSQPNPVSSMHDQVPAGTLIMVI